MSSDVVAVIDYGMGNLHSVASALEHVGAAHVVVATERYREAGQLHLLAIDSENGAMLAERREEVEGALRWLEKQ